MTPRIAMILSIGGVLAAGTAAAAVNSEVLRRDSGPPVTAPAVTAAPAGVGGSSSSSSSPSTTSPVADQHIGGARQHRAPGTPTPTSRGDGDLGLDRAGHRHRACRWAFRCRDRPTQQSFQLGSGGTAIVDTANGALRIVSVTPAPGWIVERAEQDDQTSIEIRLESGSGEVRFEASLVRGVIVVSFRADDDATGTTAVTTPGSGSTSSTVGGDDDDNSGPGGGDDRRRVADSGRGSGGTTTSSGSGSGSSGSGSSG